MLKTLILRSFWLFSVFLFPFTAHGFPENIRYGYNNCQTCHIAPTGGGILNKYGRGSTESWMHTWAYERQSEPLYGLFALPQWLDVGGDVRQVEYDVRSDEYSAHKKFLMQADLELSLELIPGLRFVSSGGHYGDEGKWERRRYYALYANQQEKYSTYFRVGRFYPAYGILLDDHTKVSRSALGFNQGQETFNLEVGYASEKGSLYITRVLGNRPSISDDGTGGTNHRANGSDGFTLKLTRFYSKFTQYSLSYLDLRNGENRQRVLGVSAMTGFTKNIYALLQYDHGRNETLLDPFDVFYGRIGYVLFKGFHIRSDVQYNRTIDVENFSFGSGIQWLPIPHFEFQATYDRTFRTGIPGDSLVLLVHYYI